MSTPAIDGRHAVVRSFNRFFTRQIGALREGLLHSQFTLTEMRVLYELAHHGDQPSAALKLGLLGKGSHQVQVDRILAPDPAKVATLRREANAEEASAPEDITTLMLQDRIALESAALAAPATAVASAGFYLQLGAYGRASGAEEMRTRLQSAGIDAATLEVAQAGSVFRLFRGPFATRADAQEAARTMPTTLGLKPLVVKR